MMNPFDFLRRRLSVLATAFALALCSVSLTPIPLAFAQEALGPAKAAGYVGERPDGLLGIVVPNPPEEVPDAVGRINAERLDRYRAIAAKNNVPIEEVQAAAGAELVNRTPTGQFVMTPARKWVMKQR
jgi:hypothetical protein